MTAQGQDALQLIQISGLAGGRNAVKTAQVESQFVRTPDLLEERGIIDLHIGLDACFFQFFPGKGNGTRCKIDPGHLPAGTRQGEYIGASAAANIDGPARWMTLYKFI